MQNSTTIQPYIDNVVMVSKSDASAPNARPVASVTSASISSNSPICERLRGTRFPAPDLAPSGLEPAFALSLQPVEDEVESDAELLDIRVTGLQGAVDDHLGEVRELAAGHLLENRASHVLELGR